MIGSPHMSFIYSTIWRQISFFFKILWRKKKAFAGFMILLIIYVIPAILAVTRLIPKLPPAKAGWENMYAPPSLKDFPWYIFGTEFTGRPLLLCLIWGIPFALAIAFLAGLFTIGVGLVIGLSAGYVGGLWDSIASILMDVALCIPSIFLALIFAAVLPTDLKGNPFIIAAILSITAWAWLARSARSQVLSLKKSEAILVAKAMGFGTWKIIFDDIMRYLMPFIFMSLITSTVSAIAGYFGIAFLGLFPIDVANWSVQLNQAMAYLGALGLIRGGKAQLGFWLPTIMMILIQVALVNISEIVEELFNPVLRVRLLEESEKKR